LNQRDDTKGGKEVNDMRIPFMRHVAWYMIFAMFLIGIAPKVDAGIAPSELIAMSQADRDLDMEKIRQVLEMKMVGQRLGQLGFTPDEIQTRLNGLDDRQLHKFALQLDDLKVGGDGGAGLAIVVLLILLIFFMFMTLTRYGGGRGYHRR
jgi:hypothetical protein